MNTPTYDNESAHRQLKQLMEQGRNLSIKIENEPCAWIGSSYITRLKYQLNTASWNWIVNYLATGCPDDFRVFPSQREELPEFQLLTFKAFIEAKLCVFRIPFLRETQAHINLITVFEYGKVYFQIKRTDEFIDYLTAHKIC